MLLFLFLTELMMKRLLLGALLLLFVGNVHAQKVTFGVISDVHQDLQKDACQRLSTFLTASTAKKPNFIIQLGDLSHSTGADQILSVWNSYPGKKYSVFGNHDMDNASKADMIAKYGMEAGHYFFDQNGVRFIVLDCAFVRKEGQVVDYNKGNYFVRAEDRDLLSDEQLEWFERVVMESSLPCVVFSHPAFDELGGSVPNRAALREVVARVNDDKKRVIALFAGHHHTDSHSVIDGVDYFIINSSSYMWIENEKSYSSGRMAEYKDPVYAFVTIDLKRRTIAIDGVQSQFLAPAPVAEDFEAGFFTQVNAGISDRMVRF